eukprot:12528531-Alexandrium_andersonii.AAC.1
MSASLVGSEMCIRDRICTIAELLPPPADRARALLRALAACCSRGVASVSYTHLTLPTICSV